MVDFIDVLSNKFIIFWYFIIMLLYYQSNLNSSITCYLSSRDIYLSFSIPVPLSTVSEVFCGDFFSNFISNFITNLITSCFCRFLNCFFETFFSAYVADCLA